MEFKEALEVLRSMKEKDGTGAILTFCGKSGLTPQTIGAWFSGKVSPKLDSLEKLSAGLKKDIIIKCQRNGHAK